MDKNKWKLFKKNNVYMLWTTAKYGWVKDLFPNKFVSFLEKFKKGHRFYNRLMRYRFFFTRKPILPTCEYIVTTRCTMNCKHCNTFMPYFSHETHYNNTTFEEFKNDIDTLLKSVDYIYCFGFVGGEPLLNKDLAKMIKYAISKRQIKNVFMVTNCTILPNQELLNVMKNKKFTIRTSNYTNVEKIRGGITVKYEEVKNLIKENGINISDYQHAGNTWMSMHELWIDKKPDECVQKMFDNCWGRFCNMLCDGKFTQCTLTVYITRNMKLTPEAESEIIDIRKSKNPKELTKQLINFYAKPYSAFCHYCHTDNIQKNLPCGEQLEDEKVELYLKTPYLEKKYI